MNIIKNTPCTLITGFLGSGKSTFINKLLTYKSENERWGLLINEFGQIGIDSSLINHTEENTPNSNSTIAIREVNGGCICCTSQLPLQIALSRLMSEHTAERLLIEPTGLAHPKALLEQLSEPHWQTSLTMQSVVCLLNAKQWCDTHYQKNEGFRSHVQYSDIVMVNRFCELGDAKRQQLIHWISDINPFASVYWVNTNAEIIDYQMVNHDFVNNNITKQLMESCDNYTTDSKDENRVYTATPDVMDKITKSSQIMQQYSQRQAKKIKVSLQPLISSSINSVPLKMGVTQQQQQGGLNPHSDKNEPEIPYRYNERQTVEGGFSVHIGGWRLPSEWIFEHNKLQDWLLALNNWNRIKGVIHTNHGWLRINFTNDSLNSSSCLNQIDSRIEIILMQNCDTDKNFTNTMWKQWDTQLLNCRIY